MLWTSISRVIDKYYLLNRVRDNVLRKTTLSFGLVFLLLMQIAALAADPFFEIESTESDLSPHDHHHSPLSISLENFDEKSFNLELSSLFDAELLMEIESNVLFQSEISNGETFKIFANVPVDFSVSLNDYEDQFEVILVLTATTIEGYNFREQLTLTNQAMYEPRCKYEFSMAEAIENDCASPPVSEIDISAENTNSESNDCPQQYEDVSSNCQIESETNSIVETYSVAVQNAFSRVSDMSQYNEQQLSETIDWTVVTEMPIDMHVYSSAEPDYSKPALLLQGSYIWSFDDSSLALNSLEYAMEMGEIEIFYPLVEIHEHTEFTPNDPLFSDQWHLENTAQHGGNAVVGEDVNITGVWDYYNGSGVEISIIDNGVQANHPDLSTNWNSAVSYDWCDADFDPSPRSSEDNHGTPVAGIAAATGNNNLGVTGAAFGANLSAQKIPLGTSGCVTYNDYHRGQVLSYYNDITDIFSNSWGPVYYYSQSVGPLTIAALEDDVQNGRGGLGNIIVFAAGNGLKEGSNSNSGDLANSRYTIAVSALTDSGQQTYYSEPGTNILVAAYAGENGQPRLTTTDRTGSDGYSSGDTTDTMDGTSAAAPLVSGIIALMLEANENLTWRDVQHILVNSARKNDATDTSWVINGAGHDVSEMYGFGVIDAGAAVNMALTWTTVGTEIASTYGPVSPSSAVADPTSLCSMATTSSSTDSDSDGYKDEECTFTLPAGETLELALRLPDSYANQVGIKLTKPFGAQDEWSHGTFPGALSRQQSNNNSNGYGNITQLGTYTAAGTYTLQIYDSLGDGCPGYYGWTYQISCRVYATYGSDWTESTITVSGGVNSIESVEIDVDISHTWHSNLDIVLVSPSGTESWLARNYHDGNGIDDIDWKFSSVHHWGEYSDGDWKLKVRDMAAAESGTLNSWGLNIYGTNNSQYVTGTFQYEDREFDETGFTGVNPYLPIRGADVEIIDNSTGAILANTYTNNQGQFSASIFLTSPSDIYARVKTTSTQNPGLFNHSVTKTPSTGGTAYTLTSQIYSNVVPGNNIDFISSPVRANSSDVAGAFNIFDNAEYAESYVENLTSQPAPLNLTLYWTAGEGTTGSKWYDLNGHVYLCGTSDDDDSYDDVVILHEIGHYIHLSYSGSPAYYGGHSLTGTYDLRLGFTEGVGTFFAGAIRDYMGLDNPLIYIETTGTNLRFSGFSIFSNTDVIGGYSNSTFTAMDAGNEATVGHVIFDLVDDTYTNDGSFGVDDDTISLPNLQGDQMVFDVFVAIKDNESTTSVVNGKRISLETFYDYWVILHPSYASAFQQILLDHDVEYQEDAMEPDDSSATATWIETDGSTYHHTYFVAGDEDWSKFNGSAGTERLIKTRNLANGADTILEIYDTDGTTLLSSNNDATSSTVASAIQFTASADVTYYIKTYRYEDTIPIGRYGDFDLTISDINHPSITSLSPSSGSVNGGYTVDITGNNFESGATVKFGVYTATDVTLNSATSMTVTVPANIPGYSDIIITNPVTSDGITPLGTLIDGFEYTGTPLDPSISSISPDFGDYTGPTEVTITGDYLIDGLTTALGSNTLSSVTVVDAKTIQATIQSVPRGVHTVTVSNPNGASSSLVNAFESTLTDIATVGSTFISGSPLQNSITISEDVRMSDIYLHINVSHPIVPAELNLTLETPTGQMISLFDGIQVADEEFQWKFGFDSIFGYDEAPSEALYQLKGESSLGDWTLHASSSSSSTNTLHSWGLTFLEYRHRDHADQVYCTAEYRNHVMSFDSVNGDLLFRSKFVGSFDYDIAVSHDGRYLYSPGATYHDGNSWENSILNVYDAWTGKIINTYQLAGRASPNSLAPVPNGNLIVVTSTQLYLIDISGQSIDANISLTYNSNWETYAVAVNPQGTIVYVTNKDENLLQTYSLPTLAHLGNMSTGTYSPFDVDISSDGAFGVIGYEEDFIAEFHTSNLSIFSNHSAGTGRASIALNHDDSEVYAGWFQSSAGFSHLDLQTGTSTQYSDGYGSTNGVYILGDRVYISEWGGNRIIVWDHSSMSEVTTIDLTPVDGYRCRGITAAEPPGMLSPTISATSTDLVLSWPAPSSGPAVTEYRVYKGDTPGNESFHATVSSSTLTYTDTSASSTALSYYRVSSVMAGLGEGPISPRLIGAPGADPDGDGISNPFDDDDDGDGTSDTSDAFPLDPSEDTDTDSDGIGNNADTDDDGDGFSDVDEVTNCGEGNDPLNASDMPTDTDGDISCDALDTDDDGDGTPDAIDAFPLDPSEDTDTDSDGIGNNADTDDDGDGWSDADEVICSTNSIDSNSVPYDTDSDGICDEVDSDRAEAGFQSGSVFTYSTLSAGGGSTCAILDNASLQCWGSNAASKLGSGGGGSTPTELDLGTGRTAVSSAIGFYTSCSILDDGSVKCWGQANGGSSGSTISIGTGRVAVAVAVGFDHACAILDDASLICWGGNSAGQLGDGTTTDSSTPASVALGAGRTAAAIAAGQAHTCAILDNASLMCWGSNSHGQLGDGTTTDSSSPASVDVGSGRYAVALSGGRYHSCAILDDGSVKCWGYNGYGNLGIGSGSSTSSPSSNVDLGTGRTAVSIATGHYHTCVVLDDASLKCWGYGSNGELGDGSTSGSNTPVSVTFELGRSVLAIAHGSAHTCAMLDNMSVQCWGSNSAGQLGDGTTTDSTTPTYVSLASGSKVAVSERDLDSDGVLNILDTHMAGDNDGDGVVDTNDDYLNNPARWISCPSGSYGRFTCTDSITGHYVPNAGSLLHTSQLECSIGTYQPSTGQSLCTDASAGYYVDSTAATSQTACLAGTYNLNTASTSSSDCTDADAGYYTSSAGSAFQTACAAGTYQSSTGQTSCTDADAGYYVSITGSPSQTACAAGTYQPSMGQSSCLDASTGYYVPTTAATSQTACSAGTYQPSTGQSSCTDASAGYYVDSTGSATQTACAAGTYNSNTASTSSSACIDASAGNYVDSPGSATQTACVVGTYQPSTGQSSCIDASAGYYVGSTGSATQTACAAGTYQANTGQPSCTDASAGYYVPSTASTSQTACAAGTYQANTGQPSCTDASAGYYVDTTASTTQTACAAGTYQPSIGQSSCTDASAGYYVPSTGSATQTACAVGTYQPSIGQSSCIDASAGYYVDTTASTTQTACAAGTYNSNTASTSSSACIDASTGNYVDSPGSATQTACSAGTYQPSTGQSSCVDASAGYYVGSTGSSSQTPCAVGTYQSSTGQSSCIDASAGNYVDITASTTQTPCPTGTYQPSTGQSSCIDSSAGYYVDTTGSTNQTACGLGTFQNQTGQSSCTDASPGYYVDTTASTTQTACALGTYQPSTGQSSCTDASAGYYVGSTGSSSQTPCALGTYQPSTGQSSCIDADPGYFVPISGSTNQTACSYGNYQPSSGQSSCIDASPGNYVNTNASIVQNPCIPGTYQPSSGQSSCLDSDAGYYVATSGSVNQTPCDVGTFQELTGQVSCVDASAGYYVNTTASTTQMACPLGSYQPLTGQTSCLLATPGHYVPLNGSSTQTPCLAGTYNPLNGSFSQGDCIQASTGNHVPNEGSASQIECLAGYFQNITGQSSCNPADPGYFVPNNASWFQVGCTYGTYQPNSGQANCLDASPGHYVPGFASPTQTACALGSYQPQSGETSCISASIGYYVDQSASTNQTSCPSGTSTTSIGSVSINDCYVDTDSDGIPDIIDPDDDNDGYLDDLDAFPLDPNEWDDTDSDGIGNNADLDDDNDGWSDITEIDCGDSDPLNGTSTPADYDEDGVCNTLDDDDDNDSYEDSNDDFPLDECAIIDTDMDGIPDWIFMNCNTNLSEDIDDDNDGYNDTNDSHPLDPSEWFDTDNDGIGNNEDTDDDGDNVPDQFDEFPLDSTEWMDTDGDGVGDNADTDNDDDGVLDTNDDFPNDANETVDTDGDGIGNNADNDDDGDGYLDISDQFPLDSTEWFDTDLDGIGNNADSDDDGDGWSDSDEFICGSDELDANDVPDDSDGDGICDSEDDDSTGLAVIVDVISNPLVVGLFLLIGAIIIVTLFLQSRNQSSKINELERMVGDSTIIEDDDQFND